MPYTPPSQQSPASSKSSSPAASRTSSYHQDDIPRSPQSTRPQPPRSHSSTSYLHKHRRSPSITKPEGAPLSPTELSSVQAVDFASLGSLRQSPPPVNNLIIPTGAIISPPDSSENSDGDEGTAERGRELEKNWDQLQQAVRAIPQQREGSPNKAGVQFSTTTTQSEPHSQSTSPTALSAEARKISHSRSATETKIVLKKPTFTQSPTHTDDSDEDEDPLFKPALVRKKSGELVKPALRPSSRRRYSSMPGTPTYSKSVHFNDSDNQTRHFLQVDKPIAVSAGSSPVETYDSEGEFPFSEDEKKPELEIKVANFPEDTFERKTSPVRVERIFLSSDKTTLVGVVAVQNISFHKLVMARFTLDYWKTTSEVAAEYNNDVRNPPTDGCDRFNFHIRLADQANIARKTLLLCVRYSVNGSDYWDNNGNTNYQIDFSKGEQAKKKKQIKPVHTTGLGQRPLTAIPRSRHTSPSATRGRQESIDDDFVSRLDSNSGYSFRSPNKIFGDATIKLKQKPTRSSLFGTPSSPANGLGSRYDFGSSLSAALSSAQDKPGRLSSPVTAEPQHRPSDGYFGPQDRGEPAKADPETERPDAITTDRPAMGSDQYRDLVQKFCYFSSGTGKGATSPMTATPKPAGSLLPNPGHSTGGISEPESATSSAYSSGSSTPPQQLDGASEKGTSPLNYFAVRAGSPASFTGQNLSGRSASPVSFGYPYHSSHRDGYLSDTSAPTAIHG